MKFLQLLNPENVTEEEMATYTVRTAARAIVFDAEDNVAVLHVTKQQYHKLPGGGVEPGEDLETALKRECMEELGCEINIKGEIGEIIEYRKIFKLKQICPCYWARVVGEKGEPSFTEEELGNGFKIKWLPMNEAITLLAQDKPLNDEGELYIVPREKTFLETFRARF